MNILEKAKNYVATKKANVSQAERIDKSIMDSIENRPMLEDEAGNIIEDTEYLEKMLAFKERSRRNLAETKKENKLVKLPTVNLDPQVGAALIRTGGEVIVAGGSLFFGLLCLKYDHKGEIVPTRLFAFTKQLMKK